MKRSWRLVIVRVLLLAIGVAAYLLRFQIQARVWHWRYGYSMTVGRYEVPVPEYWLVERYESTTLVTLVDTRFRKSPHAFSRAGSIMVSSGPSGPIDVNFWSSETRRRLEHDGVPDMQENTLSLDYDTMACLGGRQLAAIAHVPTLAVVSLTCLSSHGLNLIYTGPASGVPEFYAIASAIRPVAKRSNSSK
jgi:hypothetical protein